LPLKKTNNINTTRIAERVIFSRVSTNSGDAEEARGDSPVPVVFDDIVSALGFRSTGAGWVGLGLRGWAKGGL
jgi:hypothetical protein